jgi:hypothetical protein
VIAPFVEEPKCLACCGMSASTISKAILYRLLAIPWTTISRI